MKKILASLAVLFLLVGCGGTPTTDNNTDSGYKDGEYTATAEGHNGDVSVTVTIADGKISNVVLGEHSETEGVADPAIEQVPAAIIAANSTEVDSVSGATVTSDAIKTAVNSALEQAK